MSADAALVDAVRRIAIEVAAVHSGAVDREARFPSETLDALRAEGLLSAFVPARLGGRGASLQAIADATFELGRRCASSAMVYAMHEIQVHSIVRHHEDSRWFTDYLRRAVTEQRNRCGPRRRRVRESMAMILPGCLHMMTAPGVGAAGMCQDRRAGQ